MPLRVRVGDDRPVHVWTRVALSLWRLESRFHRICRHIRHFSVIQCVAPRFAVLVIFLGGSRRSTRGVPVDCQHACLISVLAAGVIVGVMSTPVRAEWSMSALSIHARSANRDIERREVLFDGLRSGLPNTIPAV